MEGNNEKGGRAIATMEKASIEAHKRLSDGDGLSFLNIFKAGAEWMLGEAEEWIHYGILYYCDDVDNIYKEKLERDFRNELSKLLNE